MANIKRRIICLLLALMVFSAFILAGCTDKKEGSSDDSLRAADPMTEEEIKNDDSGGCIEDAEDLLN